MRIRFAAPEPTDDTFLPRGWKDVFRQEEMEFRDRPIPFAPLYAKWIDEMRVYMDRDAVAPPFVSTDRSVLVSEAALTYGLSFFYRLFARSPLLGDPEISVSVEEDSVSIRLSAKTDRAMISTEESLLSVKPGELSKMARCAERGNFRFFYERSKDRFSLVVTLSAMRTTALTLSERSLVAVSRAVSLAIEDADSAFYA